MDWNQESLNSPAQTEPGRAAFRVAFTGHRPASETGRAPEDLARCRPEIRRVFAALQREADAQGRTIELRCSAASGADIEALEAADDLGLRVRVVLPLPAERFAQDFTGLHAPYWPRAQRLIAQALEGRHMWTLEIATDADRPSCYDVCNQRVLDGASALVAVWDGHPTDSTGGTASFVHQARQEGIRVFVITPSSI